MSEREPAKVDAVSIENQTYRNKYYMDATVKRAACMQTDPQKEERLAACECVLCFVPYGASRIGGSMCTSRKCPFCETMLRSGSTCIDVLCIACARKNGLCKHCGGDIDLKQRRKKRPFQVKNETTQGTKEPETSQGSQERSNA